MTIALNNGGFWWVCDQCDCHMHEIEVGAHVCTKPAPEPDLVNLPPHYKAHPSGVECITITEHMNFNLGNATKYIWRASDKGKQIQDLQKAAWYINREIGRLSR